MNQAPSPRPMLKSFDVFKIQNNSNYKDTNIILRVKVREKSKEKLNTPHARIRIIIIPSIFFTSSLYCAVFLLISRVAEGLHYTD